MTFEELDEKLPNGFHDGAIRSFNVDFVGPGLQIHMDLHVGVPGDADPERYRAGTLTIISPCLFSIEPPEANYPFVPNGCALNVDGDAVRPGQCPALDRLLPILPKGVTTFRFFLEEWNSFLYVSGGSVDFSWDDGEGLN